VKPLVHKAVCAVVGRSTERLERSLGEQDPAPVAVVADSRLRAGLERALATGADWIWVLDGTAVPRPDALRLLLEALDRTDGLPAPSLLTGVVVGADGRVDSSRSPWYRRYQLHVAVESADRGLLPVRASVGPALVSRDAAEAVLPSESASVSPAAVLEWTATLLPQRTGYLVPESESEGVGPARDPLRSPVTAARLIFRLGIGPRDRVGTLLEFAERALRPRSAGRGA
jgi:hypothetical protein